MSLTNSSVDANIARQSTIASHESNRVREVREVRDAANLKLLADSYEGQTTSLNKSKSIEPSSLPRLVLTDYQQTNSNIQTVPTTKDWSKPNESNGSIVPSQNNVESSNSCTNQNGDNRSLGKTPEIITKPTTTDLKSVDVSVNAQRARLFLRDKDSGKNIEIAVFSGSLAEGWGNPGGTGADGSNDTLTDKGPIPKGEYYILPGEMHGKYKWYRLVPAEGNNTQRTAFFIHPGLKSMGCVTIFSEVARSDPRYPVSRAYEKLSKMLDSTKPEWGNIWNPTVLGRLKVY